MSSERSAAHASAVSGAQFRHACGRFATGVSIATVLDQSATPHGLTVNSFSSVSLDPPLVLICLAHTVTAIGAFRAAHHFGINILSEAQRDLSDRFARKGGERNRFQDVAWHSGKTGVPLLDGTLAQIECAVHSRVTAGDHDILIGEMVHARVHDGEPLVYFAGHYRRLEEQ